MAAISTLVDPFTGASLDPQWGSGPTPSGGNADCNGGGTPLVSAATFTFTGSFLILKLVDGTSYYGGDAVMCPLGGATQGLSRFFGTDKWAVKNLDSSYNTTGTLSFFGGSDPWVKVEWGAADTLYYSSPDGVTWTLGYTDVGGAKGATYDGKKLRLNLEIFDQVGIAAASSIVPALKAAHRRKHY